MPVPFNQIDAAEELREAWAGDPVVDVQAPFFADEESGSLHHGEMLREGGDIASRHGGEIVHAVLPGHQGFHDQEAGGVGHGLDDVRTVGRVGLERAESLGGNGHSWHICQLVCLAQEVMRKTVGPAIP